MFHRPIFPQDPGPIRVEMDVGRLSRVVMDIGSVGSTMQFFQYG